MAASPVVGQSDENFFERLVRPLVFDHCIECHGPDEQSGGLRLDTRDAMLKGGDTGPVVVPGHPKKSLLFSAVNRDTDLKMPPDHALGTQQIDVLKRWIEQGAAWPKKTTGQTSQTNLAPHWAFKAVKKPTVPRVDSDWIRSPIDAFILFRLNDHDLVPSPMADKRTLIRRAYFKLHGLPPPVELVRTFVEDERPDAFQQIVEQLLDSPHYGEKWGRHWLDVARYSDTKGYVYAREERFWVHAWAYRDWVVKAHNDDMAFDRFLLLQIAADQVATSREDLAAMGFLTLGRRFLGVTHDIIDDRIDVVTRSTMGLTVSCARCHDHKYDPIPTEDYYSLYGVFRNTIECLEPLSAPDTFDAGFADEMKSRVDKLQHSMQDYREQAAARVRKRIDEYLIAQLEIHKYPEEGFDQIFTADDIMPAFVRRWRDWLKRAERHNDNVFFAWRMFQSIPDEQFATKADGVCRQLQAEKSETVDPQVAAIFAEPPVDMRDVARRYGQLFDRLREPFETTDQANPQPFKNDPLIKVLFDANSPCIVPDEPIVNNEQFFPSDVCTELWKLQKNIDRLLIDSSQSPAYALLLRDRKIITDAHVFRRGNPALVGNQVPRQPLALLSGKDRQPFQHGSGRLELAKSIIDPANPLTARVIVNRVWMHHFGQGLVRTPGDFGHRADPPSHPRLLDWLAARLVEEGWSQKWLHREIMRSATFQQSSIAVHSTTDEANRLANAKQIDPENRWLGRMSSHRLSFEELWDAALAVTGELDRTIGGKAIDMFASSDSNRRALYGRVDRQFLPSVLRVFNFANPDLPIPKRPETTVPQQALFAMNHPFMIQRARSLASNSGVHAPHSDRSRIHWMYQAVYQREATDEQLQSALEFVASSASEIENTPRPQVANWEYGYGEYITQSQRLINFTPLPHFSGQAWQGGSKWPDTKLGWVQLNAKGGHAGNDVQHAAVRRFVAPHRLTVSIESVLVHPSQAGDGIRGFLVSGKGGLLKSADVHHRTESFNVAHVELEKGETVDFVVDLRENLNHEEFVWEATITELAVDETNASPGWASLDDFAGPTTSQLTPWEQLAQVLVVANEFLFID